MGASPSGRACPPFLYSVSAQRLNLELPEEQITAAAIAQRVIASSPMHA